MRPAACKVLAANQGLYNGFLAAGLVLALIQGLPGPGQGLVRSQRPLAVLAALGKRALIREEPVLEGRISALVALRQSLKPICCKA